MVTTPQPAAQKVAQRAGFMAQKVNLEVKGVIENMSWFTGDDGKRYELFGAGGGDELAEVLGVPDARPGAAGGRAARGRRLRSPIVLTDPAGDAAQAFAAIAEKIEVDLAPTRRYRKELKLLVAARSHRVARAEALAVWRASARGAASPLLRSSGMLRRAISRRTKSPATAV